MAHLEIKGLGALDPLHVPLPRGTEVTCRVTREHEGRRVPEGTVGRVVAAEEESIDVAIVGIGTLRYLRSEVVPRRSGQVLFARRREAAWAALAPCAVLESVVGSRAWNLADEGSDTDRRGVFAAPLPWTVGLVPAPEDLVSADATAAYWSVGKTIRQALRADPNTLEMLFVEGARPLDPMGEWLLADRDAFVSTEIYGTFARYALAQLRRLEQGMRLAEHRYLVLEWLRKEPELGLDGLAVRLAELWPRARPDPKAALADGRQWVKQLYRSLHDQGLLERADLEALRRFAVERSAALALPRELRPKNAYNLLRLLATAERWLRTGEPRLSIEEGPIRQRLLEIKRGVVPLEDILAEAEGMVPRLEAARESSPLPGRADVARADVLLRRCGEEVARRWADRRPGPWGADAALPSAAEWEEP